MDVNKKLNITGLISILIAIAITITISWSLYRHTVNILTSNLRDRLEAIVLTGAVQFNANDLDKLKIESDWEKPEWSKVVTQLKKIRSNNPKILFVYILRKNNNIPKKMEFVSDSHSLNPYAKIDLNRDGNIDAADLLQWPGQPYDDPPVEAFAAYDGATTSRDLIQDQWGVEIVGYAPIKNDNGDTVAVLAVDMKADDFDAITKQTYYPFLLVILSLILILLVLELCIVAAWNKRLELLAELDKQKDELLSIVSHQLAAPITALKWYLELLSDGDMGLLTDDQQQQIHTMQTVAVNLSDLVSMILDVSRIQLGRMHLDLQELDLNNFFSEILSVIEPKVHEKNQKFIKNIQNNLPFVKLDKRLSRMIVENLLTNAIKYTPSSGEIEFNVELKNNKIKIIVRDSGCGIPKAEQKKIFGKLFRASNVRNSIEGNGFGLYVAKGAAENQNGAISFESEEGKGTKFTVEIPIE